MYKMDSQPYLSFFNNILSEKWTFDEENHKDQFLFNVDDIKDIIYEKKWMEKTYLIGQSSNFYFLAIFHHLDEYSYTAIFKHDTPGPLIKNMKDFAVIYPNTTPKNFIKSILFENKLNHNLIIKARPNHINKI